jgi:parallel beta-helix repeat protein
VKLIPPILFPKYRRADIPQVKLISQVCRLYIALKLAMPSVLYFAIGMGLASVTLLGTTLSSVVAQTPSGATAMSQVNVLFVNPSAGNDTIGNGSESTPWKTITQALRVATPNSVIMLSPGTYSVETGEVFPLMLKPGVSIQGDAANKGRGMTIQGGGEFLSRSFGGQNVTIIGANQATLTGVTITNSNPRGYGVWIESSNLIITENTFTGNTQDGISVTGNSAATISKNYFYRNGANGITIGGSSQPQVRENVFQQTGFGINITQNAAPVIFGNQIQENRSGIVVQANARPILRNNLIEGSKEDGLVAIAQAMPDLSGNEFRNNGRYDINASAAKQLIAAAGNTLDNHRIAGKVDLNAQTTPMADNSNDAIQGIPVNREITFAAPDISNTTSKPIAQNNVVSGQILPATTPLIIPRYNQQPPALIPNRLAVQEIPTETPVVSWGKTEQSDTSRLNYVRIDPNTIEFTAPSPIAESTAKSQSTPQTVPLAESPQQFESRNSSPSTTSLLPVPNSNIPLGNTRSLRKVTLPQTATTAYGGAYSTSGRGVRYRVVVEAATDREQDLVRLFAPGAFPTVWQGRRVMQAGVFSNRYNADEMLKILNSNGLRTIVEPLN